MISAIEPVQQEFVAQPRQTSERLLLFSIGQGTVVRCALTFTTRPRGEAQDALMRVFPQCEAQPHSNQ